jgi:indole-3-glycerol phosphate synthase / phosphoribosylanthranilate isomerase
MTRVKICGLREAEHVRAAVDVGADLIGFIFYPPARRYVDPRQVKEILAAVPRGQIQAVGVFVDEDPDRINEIADLCGLDLVQLSGTESVEACRAIRRPTLKTIHVGETIDREQIGRFHDVIYALHLDTARSGQYGGTGESFDWAVARDLDAGVPVLLAGGLDPGNVGRAIETARTWGVDVSSGVEVNGRKDSDRIRAFVAAVRRSEQSAPASARPADEKSRRA